MLVLGLENNIWGLVGVSKAETRPCVSEAQKKHKSCGFGDCPLVFRLEK